MITSVFLQQFLLNNVVFLNWRALYYVCTAKIMKPWNCKPKLIPARIFAHEFIQVLWIVLVEVFNCLFLNFVLIYRKHGDSNALGDHDLIFYEFVDVILFREIRLQSGNVVKLFNLLDACSTWVDVVAWKELYELELRGGHFYGGENL